MSKEMLFEEIEKYKLDLTKLAKEIWEHPEGPYEEWFASTKQMEFLEKEGFQIKPVGNLKTAFIAEFGEGKPILGVLGEYDALPGMSQAVKAVRQPVEEQGYGHACGHNLLGTASIGAALAIKSAIVFGDIKGTIRYYGCPAEEVLSGKGNMAKTGAFDDLDACLTWHPGSMNAVWGCSFLAISSIKFKFKGIPAHASLSPHLGRSALDGVELMNVGANYLREHIIDKARVHYVITNGGQMPNIVPEDAEVFYYIRAPKRRQVDEILERLIKVAGGAAMMTETEMTYEIVGGCYDVISNNVLNGILNENLLLVKDPGFDDTDHAFALQLRETFTEEQREKNMKSYFAPSWITKSVLHNGSFLNQDGNETIAGSTDVGDVSYITPFAQIIASTWPVGTASHSWQAAASSGSSIGFKAMIFAGKVLAGSLYDLYQQPESLEKAKEEFKESIDGKVYRAVVPDR